MSNSATFMSPSPLIDRVFTYLTDSLIQSLITILIIFIYSISGQSIIDQNSNPEAISVMLIFLVEPIYNIFFLFKMKNSTPGKKLFKLKIISFSDCQKLGWGQIVFREIIKKVYYTMFSFISTPVDFLLISISKQKRSLVDQLANTQVVKLANNN